MRVLIVGASRGLGLGLCEAYLERGDEVFATCRRESPALSSAGATAIAAIDLAEPDVGDRIVAALPPGDLDAIIHNAAINEDAADLDGIDPAGLAHHFEINTLGAVRVVAATRRLLRNPSKIMLIASGKMTLNLGGAGAGNYGYRMSKAALLSFGCGLGRDLRGEGVAVMIAGPGPVDTDMLREAIAAGRTRPADDRTTSPLVAGRMLRDQLDRLRLEDSPAWQEDLLGTSVSL